MRIKLIASVGVAGLLLVSAPTVASAVTHTVTDTPPELIAVDLYSPSGADLLLRTFLIDDPGKVEGVTVTVDFSSSPNDNCLFGTNSEGGDGNDYNYVYPNELALTLISASGTRVPLVDNSTYDSSLPEDIRATVLFDDSAASAVGGIAQLLESGTFQPISPLAILTGEDASGTWSLEMTDSDRGAAQCYFSTTLNVVTDTVSAPVGPTQPVVTPPKKVETASR